MVLDLLAERVGGRFSKHRARADVVEGRLGPLPAPRVVLAEPRSYMNESGGPVAGLCGFYKIPVEQLVVVHDELDIPYGRCGSSAAAATAATTGCARSPVPGQPGLPPGAVRHRPPARPDGPRRLCPERLLRRPSAAELPFLLSDGADAAERLVAVGLEAAQQDFHSR